MTDKDQIVKAKNGGLIGMGVDLFFRDQESISFNWPTWGRIFEMALEFGWEPKGTMPTKYTFPTSTTFSLGPLKDKGDWKGGYFSNDDQYVEDDDAENLAKALEKALPTVKKTERESIKKFIRLCKKNGFYIF